MEAAQGVGADGHADDQFAEHARQAQPPAQPIAADPGENDQDAQLENELDFRGEHAGALGRISRSACAGLLRG